MAAFAHSIQRNLFVLFGVCLLMTASFVACDVNWQPNVTEEGRCRPAQDARLQQSPPFTDGRQRLWACLRVESLGGVLLQRPRLVLFSADGTMRQRSSSTAPRSTPPSPADYSDTPSFSLSRDNIGKVLRFRLMVPPLAQQGEAEDALMRFCQREAQDADYSCSRDSKRCWFSLAFSRDPAAPTATSCTLAVSGPGAVVTDGGEPDVGSEPSEPPVDIPTPDLMPEPRPELTGERMNPVQDGPMEPIQDVLPTEPLPELIKDLIPDKPALTSWVLARDGSGIDVGLAVAISGSGYPVFTGTFQGSVTLGKDKLTSTGSGNLFVSRVDTGGHWVSAQQSNDSPGSIEVYDIAVDNANHAIVVGSFQIELNLPTLFVVKSKVAASIRQGFFAKLDLNTNKWLWAKQVSSTDTLIARGVAVDRTNAIYLCGSFWGTATLGRAPSVKATGEDAFIVKMDSNGNTSWKYAFGAGGSDLCHDIAVDRLGNVFATGAFSGTIQVGSVPRTSKFNISSAFVVRINNTGTVGFVAEVHGDGSGRVEGNRIAVLSSGDVVVAGGFSGIAETPRFKVAGFGLQDLFVARMSNSAFWRWGVSAGGTSIDTVRGIAADASDHVWVTGTFSRTIQFGTGNMQSLTARSLDIFVGKIDAAGTWGALQKAGGNSGDRSHGIATGPGGAVYVTGGFVSQTATFGSFTKTTKNNSSLYLWRVQ